MNYLVYALDGFGVAQIFLAAFGVPTKKVNLFYLGIGLIATAHLIAARL